MGISILNYSCGIKHEIVISASWSCSLSRKIIYFWKCTYFAQLVCAAEEIYFFYSKHFCDLSNQNNIFKSKVYFCITTFKPNTILIQVGGWLYKLLFVFTSSLNIMCKLIIDTDRYIHCAVIFTTAYFVIPYIVLSELRKVIIQKYICNKEWK